MKGIKKYLFIMAALAAVFGFVACSDDDDDDGGSSSGGPATVAVYKDVTGTYTVTFFKGETYSIEGNMGTKMTTVEKGTYKGNPDKDGDVTLTPTKVAKQNGADISLVDASSSDKPYSVKVNDGSCGIVIMNGAMYLFKRQ